MRQRTSRRHPIEEQAAPNARPGNLSSAEAILAFQRAAGNRAVAGLLQRRTINGEADPRQRVAGLGLNRPGTHAPIRLGGEAMLLRFQKPANGLTTIAARDSLREKLEDQHLVQVLKDLDSQLGALNKFEEADLPRLRGADRSASEAIERELLRVVELLASVRANVDVARRTLLLHSSYQEEVAADPPADEKKTNKPWRAFGRELDKIADAVGDDLEAIRSGAYIDEEFAASARKTGSLPQVRQAVYKAQEGRLGLLDRIASMVLAFMHTHDHVEYSLDDATQKDAANKADNADVTAAWTDYKTKAPELIYRTHLPHLLDPRKDVDTTVSALRAELQAVDTDFDPSTIVRAEKATAAHLRDVVLPDFRNKQTLREQWGLAYEYVDMIRRNQKSVGDFRAAMRAREAIEQVVAPARAALQRALLLAGAEGGSEEKGEFTDKQIANLSVTERKPDEGGHSDIQLRNVAVALHGKTLLIGYNYTVKRYGGGSTPAPIETNPPQDLIADVLDQVKMAIETDREAANTDVESGGVAPDPRLLALETITFITVPGGAGWSTFHGEMQLLEYLKQQQGAELTPDNVAFGVGKEVCRRCAAALDAANLAHRETHFRPVTHWQAPASANDTSAKVTESVTLAKPSNV